MRASIAYLYNFAPLKHIIVADLSVMLALMAGRNGGIGYSLVQNGGVCCESKCPHTRGILTGDLRSGQIFRGLHSAFAGHS